MTIRRPLWSWTPAMSPRSFAPVLGRRSMLSSSSVSRR
nr:MAG TPA: hypothetical protein [Caudoviricetes sp.]